MGSSGFWPRSLAIALVLAFAGTIPGAAHGWNPDRGTFPSTRYDHALAYTGAGIVLFGGTDGTTLYNDTWILAGGAWTQGPAAPPALTPRSRHAMVFMFLGGTLVLFGGIDGAGPKNDTWEWDGSAWTAGLSAPPALAPRGNHALAYNDPFGQVVLFGGWNGSYYNDTWDYNGLTWTQGPAAPAGLTPRDSHAMAWDPGRNRVVLFGGFNGASPLNDTWIYDGVAWAAGPSAPAGLTPRHSMGLATEPVEGGLVLFGGTDGTNLRADTWILGGSGWAQGPTAPAGLTPRSDFGMVSMNSTVVLVVGGQTATGPSSTSWDFANADDYLVAAGHGAPNPNRLRIFNSGGVATSFDLFAYGAGQWGVNGAAGDLSGGGRRDVVTGPGPGQVYGPQVRGFRSDGTALAKINFYAYGTLKYGVNVTAQDVDPDAYDEIITGAGPGNVFGPHVRGFNYDGASVSSISKINFFAYATLKFGVNVSGGDVENDGFDEILTGAGPSPVFSPTVRGWNVDGGPTTAIAKINFNAFTTTGYGTNVAGGTVDTDAYAEIGAAKGPGPSHNADFDGFDYDNLAIANISGFLVRPFTTLYGGRIGLGDVASLPWDDILCGAGPDPAASATIKTYAYEGFPFPLGNDFDAFPTFFYGATPTSGDFDL